MKENGKKKRKGKLGESYVGLEKQIKSNKKAFVVYVIMRSLIFLVLVRSVMLKQWESVMTCFLALILLLIPAFVEKKAKVQLPTAMEVTVYVFVFCAEILGEIECYYVRYRFWDTMLHTINGFMFAAFGFCLVDIFNRHERFRFKLSAGFLALVAFCFSMTIGILWEFTEYSIDHVAGYDMQKDKVVSGFSSVSLDETKSNKAIKVENIKKTVIEKENGENVVIEGGYLDIGLNDTIKDLFVNFIGAVVFSIIGYIYIREGGKNKLVSSFVPVVVPEEDDNMVKS